MHVREADPRNPQDIAAIGRLVEAYLRRTEEEKSLHGVGQETVDPAAALPEPYAGEVRDPAAAYAGARVLLAEDAEARLGVVVWRPAEEPDGGMALEVKRLWADPAARGRGIGSALLDGVLAREDGPVRLSVWSWRDRALGLYRSRGFIEVPSWDPRPDLICLRRPASGAALR